MNSIQGYAPVVTRPQDAKMIKVSSDHKALPQLIAKWGERYKEYVDSIQSNVQKGKFLSELVYQGDESKKPSGFMSYDPSISNRYSRYEIDNSLSIRAIYLNDPEKVPSLLKRVCLIADKIGVHHVHVLVHQDDPIYAQLREHCFHVSKRRSDEGVDLLYTSVDSLKKHFLPSEQVSSHKTYDNKPPIVRAAGSNEVNKKRGREIYENAQTQKNTPNKRRKISEMKLREVTLRKQYIHMIQDGTKTWEGRICSGMFQHFRSGDLVRFFYQQNQKDDVVCKVKQVIKYSSFHEMLAQGGVKRYLPDMNDQDINSGEQLYHGIPGYYERAKRFGVVGIELEVQKN